jgi:hypothetical protein
MHVETSELIKFVVEINLFDEIKLSSLKDSVFLDETTGRPLFFEFI